MTFRPGPLKAAAALAIGFIAVRVVYRVLFHGADGAGAVVLALPEIRLPAPFGHVVMLGEVTIGGLWDAVAGALPIALMILLFGALNAIVDIARLFARGSRRGPLRGVSRALAVAWATLPALADAARSVRFAQRLRGERGGLRLLAPLLQRTLDRATAVAAALELRGLAGRPVEGDCAAPVEVRNATVWHPAAPDTAAVLIAELVLSPGTLTVLAGPTGSGKTTLLRALSGLHSHLDGGGLAGTVRVVGHERGRVAPRDTAQRVGVVLQHPREGFSTERVADEIGLALDLRGVSATITTARVQEVAERVGIAPLLDRRLRELSAGEATLVAIAAAVIQNPILLLVDEPLADLDVSYRARAIALLDALAHRAGVCVVVAEHRVAELAGICDQYLWVHDGIVDGVEPPAEPARPARLRSIGDPILRARDLSVRYGSTVAVDSAAFTLHAGEIVALTGPNGAGKSSLLTALAIGTTADVTVDGAHLSSRGARTARPIALVPDASDDLFVCDTVADECRRADRRAGSVAGTTARRFASFLNLNAEGAPLARLGQRGRQHPRDLSVGERRLLALALQLAPGPRVLLVDEPTRGLDPRARELVAGALALLADEGAAILVATHDADFATTMCQRELPIGEGRLGESRAPTPPVRIQAESVAVARGARIFGDARPLSSSQPELGRAHAGQPATGPAPAPAPAPEQPGRRPRRGAGLALAAANLAALAAFCWPLVASALPSDARAAVPVIAVALIPLAALVVLSLLDGTVRSAHTLALLGTLAAIGAAIRIAGTGVGGIEAVFVLLILAGRAYGARFGLLLGMLTIALSSVVSGGIGPWTPFQMFACAWVGAGAGLLPRRVSRTTEIGMLCLYGIAASYAFGLIMNLWFWPFAVGAGTGISYEPGAALPTNLASFLVYTLVTSTVTWDTLRAITTVIGVAIVGRAVLSALRRAKPVTAPAVRPRSTSPRDDGTRTRRSTARDAAAAPR